MSSNAIERTRRRFIIKVRDDSARGDLVSKKVMAQARHGPMRVLKHNHSGCVSVGNCVISPFPTVVWARKRSPEYIITYLFILNITIIGVFGYVGLIFFDRHTPKGRAFPSRADAWSARIGQYARPIMCVWEQKKPHEAADFVSESGIS